MAVTRVCYCNREESQRAIDFTATAITNAQLDRALESAAETIEGELKRYFFPQDAVAYYDWPTAQSPNPWRLWPTGAYPDILTLTAVESPPGTAINVANVILYPLNRRPGWPFQWVELDRSTLSTWNVAATTQKSIKLTGTFGFTNDQVSAGTLAANISSTTVATCTVSDGSQAGIGDLITIDSERMVVADKAAASASLTQSGGGCSTASAADNALSTTGAGSLNAGEVILLDAERMLITDLTGGVATVKRAWDGTVLATHSGATVNAYRLWTILRGQYGSTAATHTSATAVNRLRVPAKIRALAVAETVNQVLQETNGYARTVGGPDVAAPAPGIALAELWDEARATYGRAAHARQRVI